MRGTDFNIWTRTGSRPWSWTWIWACVILIWARPALATTSASDSLAMPAFDDTILFDIRWLPTSDFMNPSHSASSSSSQDFKRESMKVVTDRNEEYECFLPNLSSKVSPEIDDLERPNPLELIYPLFAQRSCTYRLESYWTYELCHGRFVRQFHEEREGKKVKIQEYFLGKWDSEKQKVLAENILKAEENNEKLKYKKIEGMNLPYVEIVMDDGTICDLNNKPRLTRVQYVCFSHGQNEIYSFKETSTCEYEVIILSSLLCAHPKYRPQGSGENIVNCVPLGGASIKPRSMLDLEAESAKMRHQKMVDKLRKDLVAVFKLEKGGEGQESKLKLELHSPDMDSLKKLSDPNLSKFNLAAETSGVELSASAKAFLDGEVCYTGGTGWWKYEFCFGKTVTHFHIGKNGVKQFITLGRYIVKNHLEWLAKNPHKRPKPKGQQRTQISHFYSDGSICDKNGLPRQTEVKLKCLENSSSPAQVSLFMLEPKTCQYVLGVESPLICDIIQLADDDGLIDMSLIGKTSEPITTTTVPPPKNKENEIKEQELEKERERLRREREWERLDLHAEGDTYSKTVKVRHNFKKKDGEEDEFDSILD